jgi:hypothetical protein
MFGGGRKNETPTPTTPRVKPECDILPVKNPQAKLYSMPIQRPVEMKYIYCEAKRNCWTVDNENFTPGKKRFSFGTDKDAALKEAQKYRDDQLTKLQFELAENARKARELEAIEEKEYQDYLAKLAAKQEQIRLAEIAAKENTPFRRLADYITANYNEHPYCNQMKGYVWDCFIGKTCWFESDEEATNYQVWIDKFLEKTELTKKIKLIAEQKDIPLIKVYFGNNTDEEILSLMQQSENIILAYQRTWDYNDMVSYPCKKLS